MAYRAMIHVRGGPKGRLEQRSNGSDADLGARNHRSTPLAPLVGTSGGRSVVMCWRLT